MPSMYTYIPPGAADSPSTYTEEEDEELPPTSPPPQDSSYAQLEIQRAVAPEIQGPPPTSPPPTTYTPSYPSSSDQSGSYVPALDGGNPSDPDQAITQAFLPGGDEPYAPYTPSYTSSSDQQYIRQEPRNNTDGTGTLSIPTLGSPGLPDPTPLTSYYGGYRQPMGAKFNRQAPVMSQDAVGRAMARGDQPTPEWYGDLGAGTRWAPPRTGQGAELPPTSPEKRRNTDGTGTLHIPSMGNPWMDAIEQDRKETNDYLERTAPIPPGFPLPSEYPYTRSSYNPPQKEVMTPMTSYEGDSVSDIAPTISPSDIPPPGGGPFAGWGPAVRSGFNALKQGWEDTTRGPGIQQASRDERGVPIAPIQDTPFSPAMDRRVSAANDRARRVGLSEPVITGAVEGYKSSLPSSKDTSYDAIERSRAGIGVIKANGRKTTGSSGADTSVIRGEVSPAPLTKTPFSPSIDKQTKYLIDDKFINDDGSWTEETLDTNTKEGYIKDGKWEQKAADEGVIRQDAVGKDATYQDMLGAAKRKEKLSEGDSDSDDGGELADNPIPSTASSVATDSSPSSSGGGGGSGSGGGGSSRNGSSGGGSSRRGSSWRDYGDDGGSAPSWEDFLRDFDGDGDMDERDEKRARKMAMMRGKKMRGRRRGRMSTLPSITPSPLRTSILGSLSEGLGREISGWPENQGRKR